MKNLKRFGPEDVKFGPVVLGIDPSLTGFAVSVVSVSNPKDQATYVYTSPRRGVQRLVDIKNTMDWLIKELTIVDVAIEGTVVRSPSASVLGELSGVIKAYLYEEYTLFPLQVPPMSLKKFVTGKGNGVQKNQILLNVYKKWGIEFTDDNAADAYSLAMLVRGGHTLAYEKEVYAKLDTGKFRDGPV
jgi:crossover junction endodeoxyribonuclease RuvC